MGHRTVSFGDRIVGQGHPAYIIAEAGINHNGDFDMAMRMVDEAARAHADAVKFQLFIPEELANPETVLPSTRKGKRGRGGKGKRLVDVLRSWSLDDEEVAALKGRCDDRGIHFLATPFDIPHVGLLRRLDVVGFKVGSGDVTNVPMLEAIARAGKTVILSTGMSTIAEIDEAITLLGASKVRAVLLHCVSIYPTPFDALRLRTMGELRRRYRVPVGLSDHTLGIEASIAAVAVGASVIEKHFTLDRTLEGPDHAMSIIPREVEQLVRSIRNIEDALKGGGIGYSSGEEAIRAAARRGIVARKAIRKGQTITEDLLAVRRPCEGLHPRLWGKVVGARAIRSIAANAPLSPQDIEGM